MSSRSVRIVGYAVIVAMVTLCAATMIAAVMEYTGLSGVLEEAIFKGRKPPLHETGYYGRPLDHDPYENAIVQHLHPYYLFSLPWRPEDIAGANSEFLTINANGFRDSQVDDAEADAILLGGSTAFGHKSSRDRHTLAWQLGEATGLKFVNRNAPSWNSHQELVAAAKFPHGYRLSLSLSLVNDIQTYCFEAGASPFIDQPESFAKLALLVNDIRGEALGSPSDQPLLQRLFPDTYRLAAKLFGAGPTEEEKLEKWSAKYRYCAGESVEAAASAIAAAFLRNQQQIANLAGAAGGRHLVVLQPIRLFYRESAGTALFRRIYDLVMQDPWCATHCVDFSRIPGLDPAIFYDGENAEVAHFADSMHLTDKGVDAMVKALAPIVATFVAATP